MLSKLKEFVKKQRILLIVIAVVVVALIVAITVTALLPDYMRLEYTEKSDGTLEVAEIKSSYKDGWFCKASLTVPTEVKGKKVTSINKLDSAKVQTIILPDSVTEIKAEAFALDTSLKKVVLSNTLKIIGDHAWKNCNSLKNIVFPESLTNVGANIFDSTPIQYTQENGLNYIGNEQNPYLVLMGAADSSLVEVRINEKTVIAAKSAFESSVATNISFADTANITKLPDSMFAGCVNLSEATLPNATEIGTNCFDKCVKLQTVNLCPSLTTLKNRCFAETAITQLILPASVTEIAENAVQDAFDLTKFELNNEKYNSENNILYNKEMTKPYIIPDGLTEAIFTSNFRPDSDPGSYFAILRNKKKLQSITLESEMVFTNKGNSSHTFTYYTTNGILYVSDKSNSNNSAVEEIAVHTIPQMLENIVLSDKLTKFDKSSFANCHGSQKIRIENDKQITCTAKIGSIEHNYTYFTESDILYQSDVYTDSKKVEHNELTLFALPQSASTLVLSEKLTQLDISDFNRCANLQSMSIANEGNITLSSIDNDNIIHNYVVFVEKGILYRTESYTGKNNIAHSKTALYYVPKAIENVELSDKITTLEASCFEGCNKIKNIKVSVNINKIKANAFAGLNVENLSVVFVNTENWSVNEQKIEQSMLSDPTTAAELVTKTYLDKEWTRN